VGFRAAVDVTEKKTKSLALAKSIPQPPSNKPITIPTEMSVVRFNNFFPKSCDSFKRLSEE
jgi:hypothetical protein